MAASGAHARLVDEADGPDPQPPDAAGARAAGGSAPWAQTVVLEDDQTAVCEGYAAWPAGKVLFWLASVASLGLVYVVSDVYPQLFLLLACRRAPLADAHWTSAGEVTVHPVELVAASGTTLLRVLRYRYARYVLSPTSGYFEAPSACCDIFERGVPADASGFGNAPQPEAQRAHRRAVFGSNAVEVAMKSIPRLLLDEVIHPFYVFQLLSIAVWFIEEYYYYATTIFIVSAVSVVMSLRELRENIRKLQSMARYDGVVNVLLTTGWTEMPSSALVPGDLIEIPSTANGFVVPCDALMVVGSCIANESMLTGESIPVTKSPAPVLSASESLSRGLLQTGPPHMIVPEARTSKRHMLFAGTSVIQTLEQQPLAVRPTTAASHAGAGRVVAFVVRTGFETAKGQLIRSILFPRPSRFTFVRDSFRFIGIMGIVAALGFAYSLYTYISLHASWQKILLRFADLITVSVPPALPVAMTIGTSFALSRLKSKRIFCISPPRVNVAGRLNCVAFDKTGTLTEDDLQVVGVIGQGAQDRQLGALVRNLSEAEAAETADGAGAVTLRHLLASTHSLLLLNGAVVGDPVDVRMLEFSQWTFGPAPQLGDARELRMRAADPALARSVRGIVRSPDELYELWIARCFDFDSAVQRMSVVVFDTMHQRFQAHIKGAPEVVRRLARPDSVPANFDRQLEHYTHRGYRVLGLAYKLLPSVRTMQDVAALARQATESDVVFAGLLVMENALKEQTIPTLALLAHARIRTFMVTGDNVLTASSVARQCGIQRQNCPVYRPVFSDGPASNRVRWVRLDASDNAATGATHPPRGLTTEQLTSRVQAYRLPYKRASASAVEGKTPAQARNGSDHVAIQMDSLSKADGDGDGDGDGDLSVVYNDDEALTAPSQPATPAVAAAPENADDDDNDNDDEEEEEAAEQEGGDGDGEVVFAEVSITGDDYERLKRALNPVLFHKLLLRCHVYARMLPHLKQALLEDFQTLGFTCAMVGDGANDCGALRAADVGLSLSTVEASVAAPFSSLDMHIGSVLQLIREGRAALVTSFSCFKYMSFYAMIQTITVSILYGIDSNLGDVQFLFIDLVVILPLSLSMALTTASEQLARKSPTGSLLSPSIMISLFGQIGIQMLFQILVYLMLKTQAWYTPLAPVAGGPSVGSTQYECAENTTLFLFSCFLYISGSVVFSTGRAYRKSIFSNVWLMMTLAVLTLFTLYMLFVPDSLTSDFFVLVEVPLLWRVAIFGFALAHLLVAVAWEQNLAPRLGRWVSQKRRRRKDPSRRKLYKQLIDGDEP